MHRLPCFDCARKHLMQAYVLLEEAHQGYPVHRWLAVGHLAEASAECLSASASLAERIRQVRLVIEVADLPDLPKITPPVNEILTWVSEAEQACAATAQDVGSV